MHSDFNTLIPAFDEDAARAARARQDRLTKPTGSLGRLEELSVQLAGMTGRAFPNIEPPVAFVFAADHGVAAQGVSAYPAAVTAQMAHNYARGGAVINALAAEIGARLIVTDVGIGEDLPPELPLGRHKIRRGTADWTQGNAMTIPEARAAMQVGWDVFNGVDEVGLALVGEMGIGNTTTAAALAAAMTGEPAESLVGRGTGIDDAMLAHKRAVVQIGLERHRNCVGISETLAALGGLEIAAMAGAILAAGARRVPVLLDGFIATCAALVAVRYAPATRNFLVAAHRSPEPGHSVLLRHLGLMPLLDLGLRLGEASGAALAVPLLRASVRILRDVATFEDAGVSDRE